MEKKAKNYWFLIIILISIPLVSSSCPDVENVSICNQTIEKYIIDGNIDLRTLTDNLTNEQILNNGDNNCSRIESPNVSDEFGLCVDLYSSTSSNKSEAEEKCMDNSTGKNWIEELSIFGAYKNTPFEQQFEARSIGCWSCEVGTYESNEGDTNCKCDQGEKCSDYFTKSTAVAGGKSACFGGCSYASNTDYCVDSNTLREYYVDCYCCDEVYYEDYNCNNANSYSGWYNYCSGNEVWKHKWYYDYDCSIGACAYDSIGSGWIDEAYVTSCSCGCSNGACNSICPPDIRISIPSIKFKI